VTTASASQPSPEAGNLPLTAIFDYDFGMAKKTISRHRAAAKFGWLGALIALLFTLFWPSIYLTTIVVNSALGYVAAFIINYFFRMAKGK
jgi:hypothetical protein